MEDLTRLMTNCGVVEPDACWDAFWDLVHFCNLHGTDDVIDGTRITRQECDNMLEVYGTVRTRILMAAGQDSGCDDMRNDVVSQILRMGRRWYDDITTTAEPAFHQLACEIDAPEGYVYYGLLEARHNRA